MKHYISIKIYNQNAIEKFKTTRIWIEYKMNKDFIKILDDFFCENLRDDIVVVFDYVKKDSKQVKEIVKISGIKETIFDHVLSDVVSICEIDPADTYDDITNIC